MCNALDSLRPESVFGVNEEHLALTTALGARHLGSDAESVAKLGLARPELPKCLRNGHALDSALKQLIEGMRTR